MKWSYVLGTAFDRSNQSDLLCKYHISKANILEKLGFKFTVKQLQHVSATFFFFFLKLDYSQAVALVFNAMI